MNIRRAAAGAVLAVGLSFGGAIAAHATTVYPAEGGVWNYGVVAGVHLYSDYFHQNQCHGSSVKNDFGTASSPNVAANTWSNASAATTLNQNNRAYYRLC